MTYRDGYWTSVRLSLREFNFSCFTINMACGIIPVLFVHFIPGGTTKPMKIVAIVLWFLNSGLFILFCILTILRYFFHPASWKTLMRHPVQCLYIAAFPMGLVTILNGAVTILHDSWGFGGLQFLYAIWALWWFDVAVSFIVTFGLTLHMMTRLEYQLATMSATWLFPVVTLTVASTIGSVLSAAIFPAAPTHAWLTTVVSTIMLIIGLTFALQYNTMFLERLIVSGLPSGVHVMSAFLPLGPLGQSGYSFLLLAEGFRLQLLHEGDSSAPFLQSENVGEILYTICFCAGFALWAISTSWIIIALMSIVHSLRKEKVEFTPTYWGLIFPNGVYAAFNFQLGNMVDSQVFRIWGAIYSCGTIVMWLYIVVRVVIAQFQSEFTFNVGDGQISHHPQASPTFTPQSFSHSTSRERYVSQEIVAQEEGLAVE